MQINAILIPQFKFLALGSLNKVFPRLSQSLLGDGSPPRSCP